METKAYCSSKTTKRYRARNGMAHTRLRSLSCPSCGWHRLIDTGEQNRFQNLLSGRTRIRIRRLLSEMRSLQ